MEIRADGERLAATGEESQGGRRFRVKLPPRASLLTVRLRQGEQLSQDWSLILAPPAAPKWEAELRRLHGTAEIRRRLVELRRGIPQKEWEYLFRPLAVQAQADGHGDEAARWLNQGLLTDRAEGLRSEEVDKATLLAKFHMDERRFSAARQVLARLSMPAGAPADSRYKAAYVNGLLGDHLGDYGSALENLRQASGLAERGGMERLQLESGQVLARVFEELGRSQDARDLFTRLRAIRTGIDAPCDLGTFLTNEAWSQLLAREGGEQADDPTPRLQEARRLFDAGCAPGQKLNARLNLALAAQQARRWPEARESLSEAEAPDLASHATLEQRLWWLDLKGRQAIAEGNLGLALQLYGKLAGIAGETSSIEGGFRAAVGRAHAQQAAGHPAAAIASFAAADRLVDELTWRIPASEGRDTFVGQRESAVRQYLKLLLDSGRCQEAFELVRRDRSRLLRQLEVRDRLSQLPPDQQRGWDDSMSRYWSLHAQVDQVAAQEDQLPGDERKRAMANRTAGLEQARRDLDGAIARLGGLGKREESHPSPPLPGEVVLAYHPLPEGWAGFAVTPEGIRVSIFDLPDDALADPGAPRSRAVLASKLIEPFQSVLRRAAHVRVLPFGPLRSVDFHALALAGQPLLAWLPVVYGLDVPTQLSPAPAGPPAALLVANPEGNLPAALQESRGVAATIRGWGQGWAPHSLEGRNADVRAVRRALPGASLFEFAGHGELAGFGGWESALRLAAGSRLTPGDVLTLRAPPWVVLSTCEGGGSSREAPGEGIGLAQAFLLAGSRAVVAAVRPVHDTTARDFVTDLHRRWKPGRDLAQPFRQAQLSCLRSHPDIDCASFRLFEP